MAVKDHSLDDKIIHAAKQEFLKFGFEKASINRIAELAGVTTGAVYTRYKNKDALFCSLVQDALDEMKRESTPIAERYYAVQETGNLNLFLDAMQAEMRIYLDVMFRYYDQCVLFYCKSAGSSMEQMVNHLMEQKVKASVAFLENLTHRDMSGAGLIFKQQFQLFRLVLEEGYEREVAMSCMELVQCFNNAGWKAILEKNM